ncbi:hypothetical protein FJY94_09245 [Candidatus Kaiserbacteria bacterium]|nr:hypothetical protein [Candidatus Kaiserbacteria bacterium]
MRYRRRYRSRRNSSGSYFTTCKWCGERIHMREMPYGQWVAFGGSDTVHKCPESSEYGPEPSTSSRPYGSRGRSTHTAPVSTPSSSQPSASGTDRSQQSWSPPKKEEGWPAWVWWLIAIVVLYFIFKK